MPLTKLQRAAEKFISMHESATGRRVDEIKWINRSFCYFVDENIVLIKVRKGWPDEKPSRYEFEEMMDKIDYSVIPSFASIECRCLDVKIIAKDRAVMRYDTNPLN